MNFYIYNLIVESISIILILLILNILIKRKHNKFLTICFALLIISEIFFIFAGISKNYFWLTAYTSRIIAALILGYGLIKQK